MNYAKVIKTDHEHERALARIAELMDADPVDGTPEADELELLALLVDRYEEERFPVDLTDPVDAILFRMEQTGLRNKDLVQYIGSASRVSEVLNRKRDLTLPMIRKLSDGLGIPARVLVREPAQGDSGNAELNAAGFSLAEMWKRGYFPESHGSLREVRDHCSEKVTEYLASVPEGLELDPALLRATAHVRSGAKTVNPEALWAWQVRVLQKAYAQRLPAEYQRGAVTPDWLRRLAQLSWSDQGPRLAREYVMKAGIHFVVEHHLQKTYLDGAACRTRDGSPVVALTLRYDRVDTFWFTLLHELSHVGLHLDHASEWFVDDLESPDASALEREADEMASEALIPTALWKRSAPRSAGDVEALARELGISPTIVAGRARHETGEHRMFGKLFRERMDREALGWER